MFMKKKEKNKKNIIGIIIGVVCIILLTISINANRKTGKIENFLNNISTFIQKTELFPISSLKKDCISDKTKSYTIQKNINTSLEKEIKELKETLELNHTLTEYTPINATILSRNKSYWFNTITIDKGRKDNIKKNMAVVTKNGLIGKISKLYSHSSEIKLITSDDINFKVSVAIKTNEIDNYAIMNGFDKKTGYIKASGIDKTTEIKKGDTVLTSGLGEFFPGGIYIGTVEKVLSDKYNLSKTVLIKTNQNFNDIHYVTILGEKK